MTGVTDLDTWESIVSVYEPALVEQDSAQSLDIILNPGQVIRKGERNPHLYLVQGMLTVLAEVYQSVGVHSLNGLLDAPTADSIATFQSLSGLPMSGNLDKRTWKHLVLQYPLAANLKTIPQE